MGTEIRTFVAGPHPARGHVRHGATSGEGPCSPRATFATGPRPSRGHVRRGATFAAGPRSPRGPVRCGPRPARAMSASGAENHAFAVGRARVGHGEPHVHRRATSRRRATSSACSVRVRCGEPRVSRRENPARCGEPHVRCVHGPRQPRRRARSLREEPPQVRRVAGKPALGAGVRVSRGDTGIRCGAASVAEKRGAGARRSGPVS